MADPAPDDGAVDGEARHREAAPAESARAHPGDRRSTGRVDGRRFALHGVVVRIDGGRDRCTVYPRAADLDARTTTWLTADRTAFVPLDAMR